MVDLLLQRGGTGEETCGQPEELPASRLVLAIVVCQLLEDLTVDLISQGFLHIEHA